MKDLVDFAVKYAEERGVSYAEARLQRDFQRGFVLRNGTVYSVILADLKGIGIRVLVDGSLGFAATNEFSKDKVRDAVDKAIKYAKAFSKLKKEKITFSEEKTIKDKWEVKEQIKTDNIPIEEKISHFTDVDKSLKDFEKQLPNRMFQYEETKEEIYFVNSEGTQIEGFVPRVHLSVFLTAIKPGVGVEQYMFSKGESRGWEAVKSWNVDKITQENAKVLIDILEKAKAPPKGKVDVVLGSLVVGLAVHESSGHPSEADRILGREAAQAGESFLKPDMLGKQIGSELVTIVDDPTLEHSYGYYKYDFEGIPARPRYLMKNGKINEFLQNRETAAKFGIKSNAAARADGYNREPIIRMANTYMMPGDHTFEELIEDIKLGVFIKTFGEWNIDDRRYNMRFVGKEAYLIENGEIKDFVKNPILEVTTPAFYSSITALSKNLSFDAATCGKGDPGQGVPVWHGGPEVKLSNIRLGGIE
ncbi:MAG: TldD/PmbA family protein [Candidatus Asgardarchaeia archaeon]